MGLINSTRSQNALSDEDVNFDHFQILRAIGKGSFGKVCIVQKRDTGQLFAMKYVGRGACGARGALGGVCREVQILSTLEHPFLVNLWFSFQDEEDLFMVSDLLVGGDLRYHLQQQVIFTEESVTLTLCEMGCALDYLQGKGILHRDLKPDNILLDEEGHAHLTDFNIATSLQTDELAISMSGTKPYMAPEIFACAAGDCMGYSYPVDWWSLGIVCYELLSGFRPFDIHSTDSIAEVRATLSNKIKYLQQWSLEIVEVLAKLLCHDPNKRVSNLQRLKKLNVMRGIDMDLVLQKKIKPAYNPPRDHLNCDPTFELEEMILETKPLHKKKKRLAKQRSVKESLRSIDMECDGRTGKELDFPEFLVYNRCQELKRRERESREKAWERELLQAMEQSDLDGQQLTPDDAIGNGNKKPERRKQETQKDKLSVPAKVGIIRECDAETNCKTIPHDISNEENKNNILLKPEDKSVSIDYIDRTPSPV